MSATAEELPSLTFADYLTAEQHSHRRHEFVGGRVFVMAGGTERHDLAAGLAFRLLAPGAERNGCRIFTANRLLRCDASAYYPDVVISCGPAAHALYELDATLVVEVLSPSTRDVDRREKATSYARLPSLGQYVLIDTASRHMEVGIPVDGALRWSAHGPGDVVVTPYGDLIVDEFFDRVDAAATT